VRGQRRARVAAKPLSSRRFTLFDLTVFAFNLDGLVRGSLAVRLRMGAEIVPNPFRKLDIIVFGGLLYIGEGQDAIFIRDIRHLIESREEVALRTCFASVIGSLRCFGKAKTVSGKSAMAVSRLRFS
jgi:hypothetical protein